MHRSLTHLAAALLAGLPAFSSAGFYVLPESATVASRATSCAVPVNTSGYGETEPNGTKETSDPITAGTPMLGQSYSSGDTDWYYFQTTSNNERFALSFTVAGLADGDAGTWRLKIEDVGGTTLAQKEASLTGAAYVEALQTTLASPGYYFLSVTPVEHSDKNYSILTNQQATSQPVAAPPPAAVVFRRESRRLRLPVVEYHDLDGSVGYFDATLEQTGGSTFELTDVTPIQ